MCCVGQRLLKSVWTVAYDETKNLFFLGSCGCVCVLNVSNPAKPVKLCEFKHSTCNTCGLFHEPLTHRLYICDGIGGLKIWNIANPSSPVELGHYDTPGYACDVYVAGNYAYVAACEAGLRVIDVSTPTHPREVGYHDTPDDAMHVIVSESFAYVANVSYGLQIYSSLLTINQN